MNLQFSKNDSKIFSLWITSSLIWFFLIISLGMLMRIFYAFQISLFVNLEFTKHAHSHTAFWGFAGPAFFGILLSYRINELKRKPILEEIFFWSIQILAALAFPSFLLNGYSKLSIVFSSLFVIIWIGFAIYYFICKEKISFNDKSLHLDLFDKSIIFLILSTLPTFLLPIFILSGTGTETVKTISIHFFLETYGEGWLYLFSLGLAFLLVKKNIPLFQNQFGKWILLSIFPLILFTSLRASLELLPTNLQMIILVASFLWGIFQMQFAFLLWKFSTQKTIKILVVFVLLKSAIDMIFPFLSFHFLKQIKSFGIFYLHLKLLGITAFTIFLFLQNIFPIFSKSIKFLFMLGVLLTFLALVCIAVPSFSIPQPLLFWKYGQIVAVLGAFFVWISILFLLLAFFRKKQILWKN